MTARRRKSWQEKLKDDKDLPKTIAIGGAKSRRCDEGTMIMIIPAPREVDALMKRVPRGKLATINELRGKLAADHGTHSACPITTGIFAWIAAHAADEAAREGRKRVTPYWRTLKAGGELNPKYPGGPEVIRDLLEAEGHTIEQRRKRWFVKDHDKSLAKL
jgi:hypothetical protein